ncbi:MAG: hypothetical protein Q9194_005641, partial [Teloschistes cf. exilis]
YTYISVISSIASSTDDIEAYRRHCLKLSREDQTAILGAVLTRGVHIWMEREED